MRAGSGKIDIHRADKWQSYLLQQDQDPECRDDLRRFWVLARAFLVRPRVDLRRLRRSLEKLMVRHDCLLIRFRPIKGAWMAVIDPSDKPDIRQIELGDLNDADFHSRIREIANAPMPLVDHPLVEIILVKCGSRGDVLVARFHHAITDGFGVIVLIEDLIKLLIGLPILSKAVSHAQYMANYEDPPSERTAEIDAFWQAMHRDFPAAPPIGRKAKGLEPLWRNVGVVKPQKVTILPGVKDRKLLKAKADRINVSRANLLYTAFLEAMCRCYDVDRLMYVCHVARFNPTLESYAGDSMHYPILPYRRADGSGLDGAALANKENLIAALTHLPSDAARLGSKWEDQLIANGGYPGQFAVHQPRAFTKENRSMIGHGIKNLHRGGQSMGPFQISLIDVATFHRSLSDLHFRLSEDNESCGFNLEFDGISYDEEEIENLSGKICEFLDLQQPQISLFSAK